MNKVVFDGILDVCLTHADRLRWSMKHLAGKQPYTAASLSELSEIELAVFDQFIVRFSKLQDAMGGVFQGSCRLK